MSKTKDQYINFPELVIHSVAYRVFLKKKKKKKTNDRNTESYLQKMSSEKKMQDKF